MVIPEASVFFRTNSKVKIFRGYEVFTIPIYFGKNIFFDDLQFSPSCWDWCSLHHKSKKINAMMPENIYKFLLLPIYVYIPCHKDMMGRSEALNKLEKSLFFSYHHISIQKN